MYIAKYTDFQTYIKVGEYTIPLPEPPNKNKIENYNKPDHEQFYNRSSYNLNGQKIFASDLKKNIWDTLSDKQRVDIAAEQWDRRLNGRWIYIKGKPLFIAGSHLFFMDHFKLNTNVYPSFVDVQYFLFHFLEDCLSPNNPGVLGADIFKGRRARVTTTCNSFAFDMATRYSHSNVGLMNKNESEAKDINYSPMVYALNNMPVFFNPVRDGNPWAKGGLNFFPPSERMSKKKYLSDGGVEENNDSALFSTIKFGPTGDRTFDGTLNRVVLCDEIGKWANVNPLKTIRIHQLTCLEGGSKKAGAIFAFSSVEEISDQQLSTLTTLWRTTGPDTATTKWCSAERIRRLFIPFYFGYEGYVDKWGFTDTEKCIIDFREEEAGIRKNAGAKAAAEFRRRHPETIEHALMPSTTKCKFNAEIINRALINCKNRLPDDTKKPVKGKLVWITPYEQAKWVPMPDAPEDDYEARWWCSWIPQDGMMNKFQMRGGNRYPGNLGKMVMATDPIDYNVHDTHENSRLSNGAFRVKRELDMMVDGHRFGEDNLPKDNGIDFETNRTTMSYSFRPEYAQEFFEDVAKTMVFNGCPMLMEKTSTSLRNFLIDKGLGHYLLDKDGKLISDANKDKIGLPASQEYISAQFNSTDTYITLYGLAETHEDCLLQLVDLEQENRGSHDLGVAYTMTEYASYMNTKRFSNIEKPDENKKIQIYKRTTINSFGKKVLTTSQR